ncbi:TPA: type VI secretion system baseplate subunit TssG [Citrobacter freundii]|uniref:type VI secretion system baseplate subunit TssG n=1 Tax=Citrobacter freundii TaxID=546 RepID=UPI001BD0BD64|nr:type VI secretion system baseplate subunit TssG [Citrobacter freundii]HCB1602131.1 type VI secretion system baseplate subunit TssG [Citrobacter freundii]HCB1723376.1 type VI secretion system baseplate subunit TssG [Citrobacter freundii]HCB1876904.1 type VI secretion system baseplate subunit TssG [Citrobacter freundii]
MEGKNRPVPDDVGQPAGIAEDDETPFLHHARYRDFYSLTDQLHHRYGDRAFSLRTEPENEAVHFRASASLAFPVRDIESLTKNAAGQYVMTTTFMGLAGSSSPLPGYYLDDMAWLQAQEGGCATADFLNLFSHRWTQFLYHIWRKYNWYASFRNGGTDIISQRMFALIGLGNPRVRERLDICHCKLLAYAGTLAGPGRSPQVICDLVSHCFDLADVTLECWQLRKVAIPPDQLTRLGVAEPDAEGKVTGKSVLGVNFTLGTRVPDRSGKFMLCINNLSLERYLTFLPEGEEYLPLTTFVSFVLRDQLAWDLRLGLAPGEAEGMRLGDKRHSQLGRTSFIGKPPREPFVTITVRE